jgi:hypothetical protein
MRSTGVRSAARAARSRGGCSDGSCMLLESGITHRQCKSLAHRKRAVGARNCDATWCALMTASLAETDAARRQPPARQLCSKPSFITWRPCSRRIHGYFDVQQHLAQSSQPLKQHRQPPPATTSPTHINQAMEVAKEALRAVAEKVGALLCAYGVVAADARLQGTRLQRFRGAGGTEVLGAAARVIARTPGASFRTLPLSALSLAALSL